MVKEEPPQSGRHQLDSSQRRALLGEDSLRGERPFLFLESGSFLKNQTC